MAFYNSFKFLSAFQKLPNVQIRWNTSEKIWTTDELESLELGRAVYKINCAACHGIDGVGNLSIGAPALANNAIVRGDIKMHIELIKKGNNVMPAYQQILAPIEIVNVAAYERNAWGNHDYQVFIQH